MGWKEINTNLFAIYFYVCDVVLKHSGHVDFWKLVFAEHYEQTGLPTGSISHDHKLFP